MDWDDGYDNCYDDMGCISHRDNSMSDKDSSDGGFEPTDIVNPISAYFFLSNDTHNEICRGKKKNMKCSLLRLHIDR